MRYAGEVDAQRESKTLRIGCKELLVAYSDGLEILGVSGSEVREELKTCGVKFYKANM